MLNCRCWCETTGLMMLKKCQKTLCWNHFRLGFKNLWSFQFMIVIQLFCFLWPKSQLPCACKWKLWSQYESWLRTNPDHEQILLQSRFDWGEENTSIKSLKQNYMRILDADIQRAPLFELFQSIGVCIFLFIWVDIIFYLALYFFFLVSHRLRGESPQLCKLILGMVLIKL